VSAKTDFIEYLNDEISLCSIEINKPGARADYERYLEICQKRDTLQECLYKAGEYLLDNEE
jgi:hypothetical protein